jgi:hypothetical protein
MKAGAFRRQRAGRIAAQVLRPARGAYFSGLRWLKRRQCVCPERQHRRQTVDLYHGTPGDGGQYIPRLRRRTVWCMSARTISTCMRLTSASAPSCGALRQPTEEVVHGAQHFCFVGTEHSDLRSADGRPCLPRTRTTREELVSFTPSCYIGNARGKETPTQSLGAACSFSGRISALKVHSVANEAGFCLDILPDSLLVGEHVCIWDKSARIKDQIHGVIPVPPLYHRDT